MTEGLSSVGDERETIMIDATCLKVHRTAWSLRAKLGGDDQRGSVIGRTKGR